MKKILTVLILFNCAFYLHAQNVVYEINFGTQNYKHLPYQGWVEEGEIPGSTALWQFSGAQGNLSGGEGSELMHYGSGSTPFTGMTRAVSPIIDLTGYSELKFNFLYGGSDWNPGFEIGMATRSGNGDWNVVWSHENQITYNDETGGFEVNISVNNSDIGQSDFQLCFYFDGTNTDCQYLCFDNLVISEPLSNDIYTSAIIYPQQVLEGNEFLVEGTYYNNGLGEESFNAILNVYDWENNVIYSDTETISQLPATDEVTVSFDPYTIPNDNELYTIEITHDLSADLNPDNDLKEGIFNSYSTERQMVLLEIGTATWCSGCPGAALAADDFIANGDDVAVIEYHSNDDFANGATTIRFGIDYYNSFTFPTSVFDGSIIHVGGNTTQSIYDDVYPFYEERKAINTPISLSIYGEESSSFNYEINVDVNRFAPVVDDEYRILLVLTESEIQYEWMGLDELNFVERGMWPDFEGRVIDLQSNTSFTENFEISIADSIVLEHCEIIAFIQNMNTLNILQATKINLTELGTTPPAPTASFNIEDGAIDVPVNTAIEVSFSQAIRNIDDSEITADDIQNIVTFSNASNEPVSYTAEINSAKTKITITPDENLSFEETYTISVNNVENEYDIALEETSISFTTEPSGINDLTELNLEVYPNPTNGILYIKGKCSGTIILMDLAGKTLEENQINKSNCYKAAIDLTKYPKGMFFIQLQDGNNKSSLLKVVHN